MASVYSVTQVNAYVKNMFEQDFMLKHIFVRGEVSNCKYHSSGHVYFTLKDSGGMIACVLFAGNRRGMNFTMQEGQNIIVEGSISVYERDGKYQLYAKKVTLDGIGVLYERYEKLKVDLEEMGMFAEEYKKPIPRFARKIGIVTAKTGAAIQDILNISRRRNPYVQLVLYPAQVQGDGAKESIVEGIQALDAMGMDVLIVGRGGGSIEDLWAFNEECVARAIFECTTPIISAVGHEVDVTIADYVADLRAPTPSAAAELAVFDLFAFLERLRGYENRFREVEKRRIEIVRNRLEQKRLRLSGKSPENRLREQRQMLIEKEMRLDGRMKRILADRKHRLEVFAERLNGLSPLNRLGNGYAFVSDEKGKPISFTGQINGGDRLRIQLADGQVWACVEEIQCNR